MYWPGIRHKNLYWGAMTYGGVKTTGDEAAQKAAERLCKRARAEVRKARRKAIPHLDMYVRQLLLSGIKSYAIGMPAVTGLSDYNITEWAKKHGIRNVDWRDYKAVYKILRKLGYIKQYKLGYKYDNYAKLTTYTLGDAGIAEIEDHKLHYKLILRTKPKVGVWRHYEQTVYDDNRNEVIGKDGKPKTKEITRKCARHANHILLYERLDKINEAAAKHDYRLIITKDQWAELDAESKDEVLKHALYYDCDLITDNVGLIDQEYRIRYNHSKDKIDYLPADPDEESDIAVELQYRVEYHQVCGKTGAKKHGRYYTHLQNLPKTVRCFLQIDGEPVTEIDYCAMHANLALLASGEQPRKDVYPITKAEDNTLYQIYKTLLLIGINCKPDQAYARAVNGGLKDKGLFEWAKRSEWGELYDKMLEHLPVLADYIGTDAGNTLMRHDSEIAANIMLEVGGCLSIHDSFVVPASQAEALKKAMAKHGRGIPFATEYKPGDPPPKRRKRSKRPLPIDAYVEECDKYNGLSVIIDDFEVGTADISMLNAAPAEDNQPKDDGKSIVAVAAGLVDTAPVRSADKIRRLLVLLEEEPGNNRLLSNLQAEITLIRLTTGGN